MKTPAPQKVRIEEWGSSQGVRIPREILEAARLSIGDEIEIAFDGESIVIRGSRNIRGRYKLEELLAEMPEAYRGEELDSGTAQGKEVW